MKEYACAKCMWSGEDEEDLEFCPECGSEIEYVSNPGIWEYHRDEYDWNKA